jgi:peptide/nickel transport system substrate-binding protein
MTGGLLEVFDIWSMLYMYKSDKPEENVFKIAFPSDVLSLNPFTAVDLRSIWIINLIYDPLLRVDPEFNVVPWLAVSWEVSDDGKVYTFKLRKDVKWHDGTPFTADDVVFTFTQGIAQETQRFVGLKDIIEKVEKVDDYTVRFILKNPYPFFLIDLATGYYYIAPKHIAGDLDLTQWDNKNPIGTGPFRFVERTVGEFIVLEKNNEFWIRDAPKITRVIMKVIPEAESRFLAIKKGEVDTERYDTAITLVKQAEQDPNLNVVTAPGLWLIYIAFNTVNHFYDPKVFQAIHYAIDREEIVEKANGGFGYPVYTVLNRFWNGDLAAEDVVFEYNPDKAIQLLEEAGWVDVDGDGVREYVGVKEEPKEEKPKPVETMVETMVETKTVTETIVKTVRETAVETVTVQTGVSGGIVTGLIVIIVVLLGIIIFMASRMRRPAAS